MTKPRLSPGWVVVAACFIAMFGVWNSHAGFGVFLPVLSQEFGWSRGAISVAASINLLMGGIIASAVGAASDRYGPRPILTLSALLAGAAFLLASAINALWHLYAVLGFMIGVGMSALYLVPTTTVSRWFVEQRGLALGILLAGLNLAYVTGPPLSAFLIGAFGWRTAYLVLGGLAWVIAIPASQLTRLPPGAAGAHTARGGGGAAGTTFRKALWQRPLWLLFASWLLLGFAQMMLAIHTVPYVKDRGVSLEAASLALTIFGVATILGRLLLGAVADRLGATPTFWFCQALQFLTLTWLLADPSLQVLYLLLAGFGFGVAGADTAVVKAATEAFAGPAVGAIMGILSFGWRCGAALGPAAAGFIYDATGSYTIAFGLASAGLVAGFALFTLAMSRLRPGAGR